MNSPNRVLKKKISMKNLLRPKAYLKYETVENKLSLKNYSEKLSDSSVFLLFNK